MLSSFWNTVIYQPIYNALILLVNILPGHSVGAAIIVLTILVKLALYPLSVKAIEAQQAIRDLEPELRKIRKKHKDDKQRQAEMTMRLYQERGVRPFSGCLPLLIQIPIIGTLYWVFYKGITISPELLYGFVPQPSALDLHFFWFDLGTKSSFLAALAGITQYLQAEISLSNRHTETTKTAQEEPTFAESFQKSMEIQMRYVFPVVVSFIGYSSAAVALYWTTSNILSIAQEYFMQKKLRRHHIHEPK